MLDKTNSVLDDIAATIGYTATNALVDLLGGRTLFVPSTVTEGHYLEKVIGKSPLRELVKEFGNSHIYIPEGKWRDVDRKSRRVAMLFVSGKKTMEVATIIGISHVRARQIYVELEEAGLLPVVGEAREIVLRNTGGSETSPENRQEKPTLEKRQEKPTLEKRQEKPTLEKRQEKPTLEKS